MDLLKTSSFHRIINGWETVAYEMQHFGRACRSTFTLTFHREKRKKELIRQAEEKEIRVYGLSEYDIDEQKNAKATILLGYANMSEEAIRDASNILCEIWK